MAYQELPQNGRAGEDDSLPVVLSVEDQDLLQALQTQLSDASTATKQDAQTALLTTLVNRLASGGTVAATEAKQTTHQTTLDAILDKIIVAPATEAKQDTANTFLDASYTVALNIDDTLTGAVVPALGNPADAAAGSDAGTFSLLAFIKRLLQKFPSSLGVGGGLKIDGSGTALPISATALTDGTQKAIVRGGAKGSTTAADITSTAGGSNRQMLDVILRDSSGNEASIGGGGGGTGTTVVDDIGVMVKQSLDMLRHPPYMGPTGHVRVEIGANGQAVTVSSGTLNIAGMGSAAIDQSFTAWQNNNINFQLYKNRVYGY
jgi:hypothetical protein